MTHERKDMWREGKWLDAWSAVHFVTGASMGFVLFIFGFDAKSAVAIALLLNVAWELWEVVVRLEETRGNRVMDVAVGMAAFLPVYFWWAPSLQPFELTLMTTVTLLLNGTLSTFGWSESHKAAAFEERVRERAQAQRKRLRQRLARLKSGRSARVDERA